MAEITVESIQAKITRDEQQFREMGQQKNELEDQLEQIEKGMQQAVGKVIANRELMAELQAEPAPNAEQIEGEMDEGAENASESDPDSDENDGEKSPQEKAAETRKRNKAARK